MRIVAHIDMDAFFASVEERDNPRFAGLPLVVGADPEGGMGRGVVSTANYKAREYGIHSALPISKAWEYSEDARRKGKTPAIFLGVNMRRYAEVSNRIMTIVERYSDEYEEASIDEMYFDLSYCNNFAEAYAVCKKVKEEIWEKERLTCSIGIAPNKLVAKIASDFQKPNGLTIVEEDKVLAFLEPLKIRKIPGIGPKAENALVRKGITTIRELRNLTRNELEEMFGMWGGEMYNKARGIDSTPIVREYEVKSIGEQETFMQDTRDATVVAEHMKALCTAVFSRFKKSDFSYFRTIVITIRFHDFQTKTRSHTFSKDVSECSTLEFEAMKLLLPFLDARENPKRKHIRLIGVRIEKLSASTQEPIF